MNAETKKQQCPEFPFFGAKYPDATCIEGMLWDLDMYEDGQLVGGGEIPCPFCNTEAFKECHGEDAEGDIDDWIASLKAKYNN